MELRVPELESNRSEAEPLADSLEKLYKSTLWSDGVLQPAFEKIRGITRGELIKRAPVVTTFGGMQTRHAQTASEDLEYASASESKTGSSSVPQRAAAAVLSDVTVTNLLEFLQVRKCVLVVPLASSLSD